MAHATLADLDELLADDSLFAGELGELVLPEVELQASPPTPAPAEGNAASPVVANDKQRSPPAVRVPWKNRRKEEITYLRQRTRELEFQLQSLQVSKATAAATATENSEVRTLFDASWKSIARRQLSKRLRSEAENRQLKKAVVDYMLAAQRLQDLVYQRHHGFSPERVVDLHKSLLSWSSSDAEIVRQFVLEVEKEYAHVESTLRQQIIRRQHHEIERLDGFGFVACRPNQDAGVLYLDLFGTKVIPFQFKRVCDAAWSAVKSLFSNDEDHPLEAEASRAVVKLPMYRAGGFVNATLSDAVGVTLLVIQRFIEKGRMVLVWRSTDVSAGSRVSVEADVTGWCVLEPVPAIPGAAHMTGTLMRCCVRAVPSTNGIQNSKKLEAVHQVAKKLAEGLSADFNALKDKIDDSLLLESMAYDKKAEVARP